MGYGGRAEQVNLIAQGVVMVHARAHQAVRTGKEAL